MLVRDRVLIVATAAASGYHVVQLARTLYLGRLAGDHGGGCRRLNKAMACVSFVLDKVQWIDRPHAFALYSNDSIFPDTEAEQPGLPSNRFHLSASLSALASTIRESCSSITCC